LTISPTASLGGWTGFALAIGFDAKCAHSVAERSARQKFRSAHRLRHGADHGNAAIARAESA